MMKKQTKVVNVADLLHSADNKLFTLMFSPPIVYTRYYLNLKLLTSLSRTVEFINLAQCNYKLYKELIVNRMMSFFTGVINC